MNDKTITFVLAELARIESRLAVVGSVIKKAENTLEGLQVDAREIQAQVNGLRVLLTVEKNAAQKGK